MKVGGGGGVSTWYTGNSSKDVEPNCGLKLLAACRGSTAGGFYLFLVIKFQLKFSSSLSKLHSTHTYKHLDKTAHIENSYDYLHMRN